MHIKYVGCVRFVCYFFFVWCNFRFKNDELRTWNNRFFGIFFSNVLFVRNETMGYNQWRDCVPTKSNSVFTLSTDTYGSINEIDGWIDRSVRMCWISSEWAHEMVFGFFISSTLSRFNLLHLELWIAFDKTPHAKCSFVCIYFQMNFQWISLIFVLLFIIYYVSVLFTSLIDENFRIGFESESLFYLISILILCLFHLETTELRGRWIERTTYYRIQPMSTVDMFRCEWWPVPSNFINY